MGGRNPKRVQARAAEIEAALAEGDMPLAASLFDAGPWWRRAMLPHMSPGAVEWVQDLYRTADTYRDTLSDIAGGAATYALPSYPNETEEEHEEDLRGAGESAAWDAAFMALHSGWDEDASWNVAERAAETAVREWRAAGA
ncbi:hypothetical protein M8756_01910 [Lutimaribacter sp. EGI FJ00015]|uniref:Uncharacterized protein n=1 Tax=Lutimaribacter degradans TaxID=2945989 RepID=A0ACC5ZRQ8_9RHOB|nr:hypothetical protein [Lutimaribacter sp. EGI FJ00013]MCM2561004.1 hypothetical protein [Lutimaribacter sp. EGI FJ00013]MCO0612049.1 hypothetical protein [Lutimaribacter sp. EGI FJ00015]MCO0634831.1 hypothetical protein [Lutimaribacter sp. EGI FJ00014]